MCQIERERTMNVEPQALSRTAGTTGAACAVAAKTLTRRRRVRKR
jgi:hypothetical protein